MAAGLLLQVSRSLFLEISPVQHVETRQVLGGTATRCGAGTGREGGLTDAVLGLEDLVVVLSVLDLGPGLTLIPVIFAAGAAPFTLRVVLYPRRFRAKQERPGPSMRLNVLEPLWDIFPARANSTYL